MAATPLYLGPILILAGESLGGESLETLLKDAAFDTRLALDGWEGLALIERMRPDLLVLDHGAPVAEAFEVFRRVRELTTAPTVLMCAQAGKSDLIRGLEIGADDCILKPYDSDLLLARLRALTRRRQLDRNPETRVLQIRDLTLDMDRCEVTLRGQRLSLTPMEFRLLSCLATRAGRVVASNQLLEMAQGYRCEEQEAQEIIKVHVRNLRNKLVPYMDEGPYIMNVRGFGYMLERRVGAGAAHSFPGLAVDTTPAEKTQQPHLLRLHRKSPGPTASAKVPLST